MSKLTKQKLFLPLIFLSVIVILTWSWFNPVMAGFDRYQKLAEADRFYQQGNLEMARKLQREVKPEFTQEVSIPEAIVDTANMQPAAKVYWRIANEGMEQNLESKIFEPLRLLTDNYPEFIPGHLLYADALIKYEQPEKALEVLEKVTSQYPYLKEPLDRKIILLGEQKRWLEAAIAARQFAISYPEDPDAGKYYQLAEENTERYQNYINQEIMGTAIGSIILSTMVDNSNSDTTVISLLLEGEVEAGEVLAEQYKNQLTLVEDPEIVNYVNEIGQKLAHLMGRDEFNYEFFVVKDPNINAFALPGGKIFINTGILELMNSEAELAGLLGHEIAHAVLSHSFQKMASGAILDSFVQIVPMTSILRDLGNLQYSRDLERQADILGTRVIATSGYAADGLYSVMDIFKQLEGNNRPPSWLSTHPAPTDRIAYLEQMIETNGYNRYAYEGVEAYQRVFK